MEYKGHPKVQEKQDFGDFKEIDDSGKNPNSQENVQPEFEQNARVRMPRQGEFIGIIVQRYGANRMDVKTTDGKSRNCRVPGRFKRSLWLRPRDIVMIKPWPDDDSKGDVIFKYNGGQINQLRKRGILDNLKSEF